MKDSDMKQDLEDPTPFVQQATHEQSKSDLLRVAWLQIAGSSYAVDVASLHGFALGIGLHPAKLEGWLREKLGADYPTELPEHWLYAKGL